MTIRNFRYASLLFLAIFFLTAGGSLPVAAQDAPAKLKIAKVPNSPEDLDLIDVGSVAEVRKSDIIRLNNGKVYHLDHIRVPVFFEAPAVEHLRKQILGRTVGIYAVKNARQGTTDRYGNLYAQVLRDDGMWVQADLVARGLAWAYSTETNRVLILPLYKYESSARALRAGFWQDADYAIKDKTNIGRYLNSYQIVQGVITAVVKEQDRVVLKCDMDGRNGASFAFSIRDDQSMNFIPPGQSAFSALGWHGGLVRVRGWIEREGSTPMIHVTHPEQMEFLDPSTGEPTTKVRR